MIAAYNGHREVVRHLLEKNADISVKDRFDKKAIDRAKDSKIIRMLEQAASAPQKHNDTREEHKNERQLHSILKNSTSKAEIDHSKSEELETTKIQEPSNIHNITNQSTVYAPARQQGHSTSHIELSQDQLVTPPPRNDFYSPQNISYNSREHNVSSFVSGHLYHNFDRRITCFFNSTCIGSYSKNLYRYFYIHNVNFIYLNGRDMEEIQMQKFQPASIVLETKDKI